MYEYVRFFLTSSKTSFNAVNIEQNTIFSASIIREQHDSLIMKADMAAKS
jgi:hypothetical protein